MNNPLINKLTKWLINTKNSDIRIENNTIQAERLVLDEHVIKYFCPDGYPILPLRVKYLQLSYITVTAHPNWAGHYENIYLEKCALSPDFFHQIEAENITIRHLYKTNILDFSTLKKIYSIEIEINNINNTNNTSITSNIVIKLPDNLFDFKFQLLAINLIVNPGFDINKPAHPRTVEIVLGQAIINHNLFGFKGYSDHIINDHIYNLSGELSNIMNFYKNIDWNSLENYTLYYLELYPKLILKIPHFLLENSKVIREKCVDLCVKNRYYSSHIEKYLNPTQHYILNQL